MDKKEETEKVELKCSVCNGPNAYDWHGVLMCGDCVRLRIKEDQDE